MRTLEEISAEFRDNVARGNMDLAFSQLQMRLLNLKAQSLAEMHSYCECPSCARLYNTQQWVRLRPVNGGLWRNDAEGLEEFRTCAECESVLHVVERRGKRMRPRSRALMGVARGFQTCCGCNLPIQNGDVCVVRTDMTTGRRVAGRWAFCSVNCEEWG